MSVYVDMIFYHGHILSIILYTWPGRCRYLPSSLPAVDVMSFTHTRIKRKTFMYVSKKRNEEKKKQKKTTIYKPFNN